VGYVIEDQVTFGGAVPANVAAQVHQGNAIPDFVSTHGAARGVIDVTSSGQQGHVLDKAFNKAGFGSIAEATYPSIDFTALNGGAAPVLGAAALALAQQAKRQRANSFMGSELLGLRQRLELLREGVMHHHGPFALAAGQLAQAINGLPGGVVWTALQVANIDVLVGNVNGLLAAQFQVPNLTQIIAQAHNHYLVPGNPWW